MKGVDGDEVLKAFVADSMSMFQDKSEPYIFNYLY